MASISSEPNILFRQTPCHGRYEIGFVHGGESSLVLNPLKTEHCCRIFQSSNTSQRCLTCRRHASGLPHYAAAVQQALSPRLDSMLGVIGMARSRSMSQHVAAACSCGFELTSATEFMVAIACKGCIHLSMLRVSCGPGPKRMSMDDEARTPCVCDNIA